MKAILQQKDKKHKEQKNLTSSTRSFASNFLPTLGPWIAVGHLFLENTDIFFSEIHLKYHSTTATHKARFLFFFKFLEISPFRRATDTPAFGFQVVSALAFKAWVDPLWAVIFRFTSGV